MCHPPFFRPLAFSEAVKPAESWGAEKTRTIRAGSRGKCMQNFRAEVDTFIRPQAVSTKRFSDVWKPKEGSITGVCAPVPARGSWSMSTTRKMQPAETADRPATGPLGSLARRRLRRNGRLAPKNGPIDRNAKLAIPGALKAKSPHSAWTCAQKYYSTRMGR
jgi:hypothetical protein